MTTAVNARERIISVCGSEASEPVMGFVVLRAIADVIAKDTLQRDVAKYDGGYTVAFRLRGIDMEVMSESGGAISPGRYCRSLLLKIGSSGPFDDFKVQSAFSQFMVDFHRFVTLERADPVPALWTRVCRECCNPVKWDTDLRYWWCSMSGHGLLLEEETFETMTNPFDL